MKLYKYISFGSHYWSDPILKDYLYFSSNSDLKNANDPLEFNHEWDSKLKNLQSMRQYFRPRFQRLFDCTRILCLSRNYSKYCWEEFCGSAGGICCEFDFQKGFMESDIIAKKVIYKNIKQYNFINFLTENIKNNHFQENSLNLPYLEFLKICTNDDFLKFLKTNLDRYILNEITFTKDFKFKNENEFRFVHIHDDYLLKNKSWPNIATKFDAGKLQFNKLGLKLKKIFTNDKNKVQQILPLSVKTPVKMINF